MTATVPPSSSGSPSATPQATPPAPAPPAPSGTLSRSAQRLVLAGMVALCSLGAFEALAVSTAMPTVAVELDGLRYYTLAFAVTFATSVVGMLVAGRWCDRSGPSPAMWTGVGLFVVGLVVAGTATDIGTLVAGRAVQGVGNGLYGVALYVLVARVFAAERHPAVFSAFAAAWVVPAIVGPGLAGLLVDHVGWRWVFLGAAALTVPAAILMRPGLTAARGDGPDPVGSADRTVSGGEGSDRSVSDGAGSGGPVSDGPVSDGPVSDGAGSDGAGSGGAAPGGTSPKATGTDGDPRDAAAARQPDAPSLHALRLTLAVLRAGRGLPAVVSVRALVSAAFVGAEVLLPLLLVHERHLSPGSAGLILTVGALGWSGASWVRGRDLLHLSHAGYVRLGGGLLALGMVGAAVLVVPAVPAWIGMAFWVLSGSGMGLVYPTLSVLTLELAAPHEQGSASSALQVADAVAAAVASTATGALLWTLHDVVGLPAYAAVLGLTGLLATMTVLLASRTRRVR
ncbi:MFS transporter [Promicromonospora sp. NPDC060271]|uniref:MFS transporter n=1 Tax=Promicromonospora sp. NPDC060271 TaxID=3347089 RepID=UPI003656B3D2